jgi:hypothetical protein
MAHRLSKNVGIRALGHPSWVTYTNAICQEGHRSVLSEYNPCARSRGSTAVPFSFGSVAPPRRTGRFCNFCRRNSTGVGSPSQPRVGGPSAHS